MAETTSERASSLRSASRLWVTRRTPTGRLLVFNAFSHKLEYPDLYLVFVPDDDEHTRIEIHRI